MIRFPISPAFGHACASLAICLLLGACAAAQGQLDVVKIGPVVRQPRAGSWSPIQTELVQGRIRQLDATELIIRTEEGDRKYASNRVEAVTIVWANEKASEAFNLVEQRRYSEAIPAIDAALKTGIPVWQQRFLIASLIRSLDAVGKTPTAGVVFIRFLSPSRPPPLLYADLPLCWRSEIPDASLTAAAEKWLVGESEIERLLGASWLLLSSSPEPAEATLKTLLTSQNESIAKLASLQLLRLAPPPETLKDLPNWLAKRDGLIPPLQLGPSEFIAERLARINETELALGEWMRIASNHTGRYHRAVRALKSASALLDRQGKQEEAAKLSSWISDLSPPKIRAN